MPTLAELIVDEVDEDGYSVLLPGEAELLATMTDADKDRVRFWWFYTALVPILWKRLLSAPPMPPAVPDPVLGTGNMPGYLYDLDGFFRTSAGKQVAAEAIGDLARHISVGADRELSTLARLAVEGRILPADFQRAFQYELKNLYNANAALGKGGLSQMTFVEWGRNGQILRGEYRYLAGFAQDIFDGKLTVAFAMARARLYTGKSYSRYWDEDRRRRIALGKDQYEQWIDTKDENECGDCPELAALGKVPIGTLPTVPGAGDTACLGNCRCGITYYAS